MKKLIKFGASGGLTYGVNLGLTYLLIQVAGVSEILAYGFSILLITFLNFYIALKHIFKQNFTMGIFLKYLFFLILFSFLNYVLVFFIKKNIFEINIYESIFIVTTFIFIFKYFIYDRYVFR